MNDAADDLVQDACAAHGGRDAWEQVHMIEGRVKRLSGPIPWMKGLPWKQSAPGAFVVLPHRQRVEFRDYPERGLRTVFQQTPEGAQMGVLQGEVDGDGAWYPAYRARFGGIAKWRFWTSNDAAYFFGYALLTYFSVPFILGDLELVDSDAHSVTVRFPKDFDTHCPIQRFHFSPETRLIERHEYDANVLGAIFRGVHVSSNYAPIAGIMLARTRRVVPRAPGGGQLPVGVLSADLEFEGGTPPTAP